MVVAPPSKEVLKIYFKSQYEVGANKGAQHRQKILYFLKKIYAYIKNKIGVK